MQTTSRQKWNKQGAKTFLVSTPSGPAPHYITVYPASTAFTYLESMLLQVTPRLIDTALDIVLDRPMAEDIVQHTLFNAYLHFGNGTLYVLTLPEDHLWIQGSTYVSDIAAKLGKKTIENWLQGNSTDSAISSLPVEHIENLEAWLCTAVHNTAINYYHKRKRWYAFCTTFSSLLPVPDPHFDNPEQTLLRAEQCAQVRAYVQALPSQYREVIELRYWEEHSFQTIADILQRPIGTVRCQAQRGLHMLGQVLREQRSIKDGKVERWHKRSHIPFAS